MALSRLFLGAILAFAPLVPAQAQVLSRQDTATKKFTPSEEVIPNPEQGMIVFIKLDSGRDFTSLRDRGYRIVYAGTSLAAYRKGPIDASFLAKIEEGFQAVRKAGLKVALRFTYSGRVGDADAPKEWILKHIEQLKPLLEANADVIAVMQAGFIGAWGEWHGSTNGLDDDKHRKDILLALLAALPPSRAIQVRVPTFKQKILGGGPLAPQEAFKETPRARVGHHNDAFFAGGSDLGTYPEPVKTWKDWIGADARFVPYGAETTDSSNPDPAAFMAELRALRASFLHIRYSKEFLDRWEKQGHMNRIRNELGYRLTLLEATHPGSVRPGGELRLSAQLRNSGYAAIYNKRPLYVVLTNGRNRFAAKIASVDPRRWEGGQDAKFTLKLSVPTSAPTGKYRLSLWLPDDAPSIAARPEYAVRFANEGVWDPATGENTIGEVTIGGLPAAGGLGTRAKDFVELP